MRSLLCAAVAAALTFGAPAPTRSQTSSDLLTPDEAVREALASNRDLQAARSAIDVARGVRLRAGRLENPELELGYADDFAFKSEGERVGSVGLAQRLPVTARLAREKDVAARDVEVAEAEVRDFARKLVADVQRTFYSIRALDEQLGVNRQLIASVREVENATARRLEAAEASPAEVGLLRIERLRLEQVAQHLMREREVAAAGLARLLGRSSTEGLRPVGELDPGPAPPPRATSSGTSDPLDRPDLEAARRGVQRADADRALADSPRRGATPAST